MSAKLIPTKELLAIVRSRSKLLVVKAFAGTGKTTALTQYARFRPKARILYLAYNKAMQIAAKAKFGRNVDCKTTHGLAYAQFGRPYGDCDKLGNFRAGDVSTVFKLSTSMAKSALDVVNNFIYSSDENITGAHMPLGGTQRQDLVLDHARALWDCMQAFPSEPQFHPRIKMSHDGYLKLFQLHNPDLSDEYDIILLDEAQDANPVTAAIVLGQKCIRVLVGDTHQSIYQYRGSVDALETTGELPGAEVLRLTTSYRFGPDIATLATALLSGFKQEDVPLRGAGGARTISPNVDKSKQHAVICRTNATVFSTAANLLGKRSFSFIGGVDSYPFDRLVDVQCLAAGKVHEVVDPLFKQMGTLGNLAEYAKNSKDPEIGALLGVQKEFGARIPGLVDAIKASAKKFEGKNAPKAIVELMTAHRSKGLEFHQVVLMDDFEDFVTDSGHPKILDTAELVQEMNLLYVAATRATHALQVNSSVTQAMSALGQTDFVFPDGTEPSSWVDSLLDNPVVKRQESINFEEPARPTPGSDAYDNDNNEVDDATDALLARLGDPAFFAGDPARTSVQKAARP